MKKIILNTIVLSLTLNNFNLFADEPSSLPNTHDDVYQNLREAPSGLITRLKEDEVERLYKNTRDMAVLRKIISDREINRCATKVVDKIKNELGLSRGRDVELAILGLRLDDDIDDVSASILIKANDLSLVLPTPIAKNDLTAEEEEKALDVFKTKAGDLQNKSLCPEDTYRELVSKLASNTPKFYKNLKHINKLARDNNLINESSFKRIEVLRARKVQAWPLTLSDYATSLELINKKFPERKKESSSFVTNVKFRQKISMRQALFEKYDSSQIILLANIVKNMKARLESTDVTININYVDRPSEIVSLTPMEKFRFILKLLRKDLSAINNSSLLNGMNANYMDLITASYEVGYISAEEIEQLASLQDIWNPKKTTKQKVMFWVDTFGGVASVFLPPPFGFVSVMAIMMIDQQVQDAPVDRDPDFNLF